MFKRLWPIAKHMPRRKMLWIPAAAMLLPILWYATAEPKQAKPWQVTAYSTLPLKVISRLWGQFNDINLPVFMRAPGFKLYSWFFGVNLDEMKNKDLSSYKNLSEFFYRELEDGVRPLADAPLVSPSDGKVLQFGELVGDRIEQVKGMSYSLDAFLGPPEGNPHYRKKHVGEEAKDIGRHQEFAQMNGISYTVDDIVGTPQDNVEVEGDATDKSAKGAGLNKVELPDWKTAAEEKSLYYAVIYLAPGDYHRFHSPANWVVQVRRYFVGELLSVAPFIQSRVGNLFCLNERVALLGKWKYGFFSMTPVGATNVGSITINFDKFLKTNTRWIEHDNEMVRAKKKTCYEATYSNASPLLRGFPLEKGEEMGGFHLGSTVVLVFEAPKSFEFDLKAGQVVKMGQQIGAVKH